MSKPNTGITRRNFIFDSAAVVAASRMAAGAKAEVNVRGASALAPLPPVVKPMAMPLSLSDVRLLDGPFQTSRDAEARYLLSLDVDRLLAPYRMESGLKEKAPQYLGWETDYLPGVALAFYLSGISNLAVGLEGWEGNEFHRRLLYILEELDACQQATGGYLLGTRNGRAIFARIEKEGKFAGFAPWGDGCAEPYYALEKIFSGLRDAYRVAGQPKALQIEVRLGNWLGEHMSHLNDGQMTDLMTVEFGGMNWVLSDLYADTGDERYMKLSRRWQDRAVFDSPAAGIDNLAGEHANTQFPKFAGLAARYPWSGDPADLKTAAFFWESVVKHHSYATGGNSEHEHFDQPNALNDHLSQYTEENCNEYNMLRLTQLLFNIEPKPEYAEYMERTLFNHILSAQDVRDGRVCYFLPLKSGASRAPEGLYDDFACCVCSAFDSYSRHAGYIYSRSAEALYVNLFIASEVKWKDKGLVLRQETTMPDDDTATFSMGLRQPVRFSLYLRYPAWASDGINVQINGAEQKLDAVPGKFFVIDREWSDGDTVLFKAPLTLRYESIPGNQNRMALFAGPILLAGSLGPIADPALDDPGYIPLLVPGDQPVSDWLRTTDDPCTYITTIARPREIKVQPFFRVRDCSYIVYWDRVTPAGWIAHVNDVEKFHVQSLRLDARTVDRVAVGDLVSEMAHQLNVQGPAATGQGMRGLEMHLPWRTGESFAYEMQIPSDQSVTVRCRYFSQRYKPGNGPDIEVEGVKISYDNVAPSTNAITISGVVVEYPVPLPITKTNGKVRVRIRSAKDLCVTDLRILRSERA
jgi:DUF1680 family protein